MSLNKLERRVVELTYKHKRTHLSSCLNVVNLIAEIYAKKKDNEPFILGAGHAFLGLAVVLEHNGYCNADWMVEKYGTHPTRDMKHGVWCSAGSLGQAESIALGFALADPMKRVWLVTSDGSAMEGSTWETLRLASQYAPNLKTFIVYNGWGAFGPIRRKDLPTNACIEEVDQSRYPEWLRGLDGHYIQINQTQYEELMA